MPKRKRGISSTSGGRKKRIVSYKPSRAMQVDPGVTRTSGYYGRFYPARRGDAEKKFFDGSKGSTVIASTGTIMDDSLNEIAVGTGEQNRIGRKCVIKNIRIKGRVTLQNTVNATDTDDRYRIIIYMDTQANGATAAVLDILETTSINAFRNLAEQDRFVILYDKTRAIHSMAGGAPTGTAAFGALSHNFKFNKKCNVPIEYSSTTGAITEIRSNNIGVLAISQSGFCTMAYQWRLRFSDN